MADAPSFSIGGNVEGDIVTGKKQTGDNSVMADEIHGDVNMGHGGNSDTYDISEILQIYGDVGFGKEDAKAIDRAGVNVQRITEATGENVQKHIRRLVEDQTMPRFAHISSHASSAGVILQDGTYATEWWASLLPNGSLDILFLDSCENVEVADAMIGVSSWVFCTLEEIGVAAALTAAFATWYGLRQGMTPEETFEYVKEQLRTVEGDSEAEKASEFFHLRGFRK